MGHTDDLEARVASHQLGTLPFDSTPLCQRGLAQDRPGYTARRRPVALVHAAEFSTRIEALTAERQLKGWSRKKKEAFIVGDWERVRALAVPKRAPDRGEGFGANPEEVMRGSCRRAHLEEALRLLGTLVPRVPRRFLRKSLRDGRTVWSRTSAARYSQRWPIDVMRRLVGAVSYRSLHERSRLRRRTS